ncbi:hypothetical protein SAMN02745784_00624 [Tissierella praeacuta DSM 18095]|uniref:Alcohol acetyltransferase n=1 Tax=Tissierella praeacuta DSM 18095 TaxID=1123404 RepID=A0A1M4TDB5_9FIRM|nr:hypothetical protein [Tissierella praeacuta]TCU68115.1 hypothetical protein EV204_11021 [Tissierella praeacuta]SHE42502.1 hypothetical protein SAMN02745784_00624 [Tissierella praeacuta DSM 18095]SUP04724.1 Uncharacterised protein [Tissierella praeacuta]
MKQQKEIKWTKLDNASKLFPAIANNKDTKVFRLSCELYEDVDPIVLQKSLDLTIESFPLYKSVLRRGAFWYYFEYSDIKPTVNIEDTPLCAPIYIKNQKNLLFRVSYYNKRINVEIFHSLTDGAGLIWFMEILIYHYMTIKYKDIFKNNMPKLNHKASISQKLDDSFWKNYNGEDSPHKIKGRKYSNAYYIKGSRITENRMMLIEGAMSVKSVLDIAHEYNTTLTVFLASLLIYSIYKEMPANRKKRPIVLSVPINLRPYYASATARNFFSTMDVGYSFANGNADFKEIIDSVNESFKRGLTKEQLDRKLNHLMSLEKNPFTRIIPLPLKDLFLRIANRLNDKKVTSSISNVGKIIMPKEFDSYIRQFSICVSARRPLVTLCTYGDRMVISFTSPFEETDIQKTFFQFLSEREIEIEITSNL